MADKVEISDPYKVDPTLKDKSVKQLEAEITLRQMALEERRMQEEAAVRGKLLAEAEVHMAQIVESLKWLEEKKLLNEKVKSFFTTAGDKRPPIFAPHLMFRTPKV